MHEPFLEYLLRFICTVFWRNHRPLKCNFRHELRLRRCALLGHLSERASLASEGGSLDKATSNRWLCHGLLHRGDVSRGSSTESARATLLQGGDASKASANESARATLLQSRDASIQLLKKNH